jgi:hypothetical protein
VRSTSLFSPSAVSRALTGILPQFEYDPDMGETPMPLPANDNGTTHLTRSCVIPVEEIS